MATNGAKFQFSNRSHLNPRPPVPDRTFQDSLDPVQTSGDGLLPPEELPLFVGRLHFRFERRDVGVDVVVVEELELDADGGGERGSQRRRLDHLRALDGDA